MKWFAGVTNVEELRKKYRELLKKYHLDNENGSVEITQKINDEYDRLFANLSKKGKTTNLPPMKNTRKMRYLKRL